MRKMYVLLFGFALFFQSCVTTEKIEVKSNGEMTYNLIFEFSELMQSVPEAKGKLKGNEDLFSTLNGKELSMEDLMDLSLKNSPNGAQKRDSILDAHPNFLKDTENLSFKMLLNDSIGNLDLKIKAKSATDLNNTFLKLKEISTEAQKASKKKDDVKIPAFVENTKYEYNKNSFERKIVLPKGITEKESDLPMGGMDALFSYIITVSFENQIKTVSYKDAEIATDRKSFTKRFSLGEVLKDPKILEYKVELKK